MPPRSISASPEQWARLAERIYRRRLELGYSSQDDAAKASNGMLTRSVWQIAETHAQKTGAMAESSLHGICWALDWTTGSALLILDGEDPVEERHPHDRTDQRLTRLEEQMSEVLAILRGLGRPQGADRAG